MASGASTIEVRSFQGLIALLASVPLAVGLAGVIWGPAFLLAEASWPTDLDSHFRFLSGIFVGLGIAWFSCVPDIGAKTRRFRLLAALTFAGGVARLVSLIIAGAPSAGHLAGLCMELLAVPM
nr:DUF4345 domain-containing protein [Pseudaminobacter sp.]